VTSETFLIAWRRLAEHISALTAERDLIAWDASEHVVERAAALDALATLPADDVETLTLVTWHGLSAAEAAAVVGCSPRAFTVRLHRARKRLAGALLITDQSRAYSTGPDTTRVPQPSTSIPNE
jgi:DNA-directed RNA polymerase specialized sigma24 family protein